jgi:hypothetical protein
VVGDWDGDGDTGIGIVAPSTAVWYLRNTPSAGNPDYTAFQYGLTNGAYVTGDWTGQGTTGLASVAPLNGPGNQTWYMINTPTGGATTVGNSRKKLRHIFVHQGGNAPVSHLPGR